MKQFLNLTIYSTGLINERVDTTGHKKPEGDGAANKPGPNGARGHIYTKRGRRGNQITRKLE